MYPQYSTSNTIPCDSSYQTVDSYLIHQIDGIDNIRCRRRGGAKKATLVFCIQYPNLSTHHHAIDEDVSLNTKRGTREGEEEKKHNNNNKKNNSKQVKASSNTNNSETIEISWKALALKNFSNRNNIAYYERNSVAICQLNENIYYTITGEMKKKTLSQSIGINLTGKNLTQHPRYILSSGNNSNGASSTLTFYSRIPINITLSTLYIEYEGLEVNVDCLTNSTKPYDIIRGTRSVVSNGVVDPSVIPTSSRRTKWVSANQVPSSERIDSMPTLEISSYNPLAYDSPVSEFDTMTPPRDQPEVVLPSDEPIIATDQMEQESSILPCYEQFALDSAAAGAMLPMPSPDPSISSNTGIDENELFSYDWNTGIAQNEIPIFPSFDTVSTNTPSTIGLKRSHNDFDDISSPVKKIRMDPNAFDDIWPTVKIEPEYETYSTLPTPPSCLGNLSFGFSPFEKSQFYTHADAWN